MAHRLVNAWSTRLTLGVLLLATAASLDPRLADAQGTPAGAPKRGGILRVAMIGEPPSLDAHMTTATITREIGAQIFETLYTLDGRFETVPHLAEGHEVQDGGKRYVIRLRGRLLQTMAREPDAKKRLALWERVQTLFYEDAARIRLGDSCGPCWPTRWHRCAERT
jgi:hypothetical protein